MVNALSESIIPLQNRCASLRVKATARRVKDRHFIHFDGLILFNRKNQTLS